MTVPIDDKGIVRAYALKEELLLTDNKLFQVSELSTLK